jgi:hypothetical protein
MVAQPVINHSSVVKDSRVAGAESQSFFDGFLRFLKSFVFEENPGERITRENILSHRALTLDDRECLIKV